MAIASKFINDLAKKAVIVADEETSLGDALQQMRAAGFEEGSSFLVVRPSSGHDFRACGFARLNQLVLKWFGVAVLDLPLRQLPIPVADRILALDTPDESSGGANNWLKQHPNGILIVYDAAGNVYLFCNVLMSASAIGGISLPDLHGEWQALSQEKRVAMVKKYPPALCPKCQQGYAELDGSYNLVCGKCKARLG